ncbi:MAG TPA: O-antigen ligase family protein [Terriglobia bacterium]|nr:O-antigen ligase family protein [Terriglobia bacterium]
MSRVLVQVDGTPYSKVQTHSDGTLEAFLQYRPNECWALGLAFCAVPISIVVSEIFLVLAIAARIVSCVRGQTRIWFPRVCYFWLAWAGLEILSWVISPEHRAGWSEIRHLLLIAAVFFVMPAINKDTDRQFVWRGVFLTSTLGALFLLADFASRIFSYWSSLGTGDEASLFLRSGGLLNNWMVFGTVEILVMAGFLVFWSLYPEERRRWWPVAVIHGLAILFSLTRMTWITCFLLLAVELVRRRSKWLWVLPFVPLGLYVAAPSPVRLRVLESLRPDFYSNAERLQMLRVGWRMIKERPLTGVGPGRVESLYRNYLKAGEPVPAYHGHLHNNAIQLAAEFGIPVALAAMLTLGVLFLDLVKASRAATSREAQFVCRAGLLGLIGFVMSGFFDYTYGHSLGLILLGFVVISPLLPESESALMANH